MPQTMLPPQDGILSISEGIDGETALQALRHSEAYFRSLVENARDVIHVINEDRTTRYITPSVQTLLGWAPGELVGRSALDIIHPDDAAAALEQIRLARETPGAGRPLTLRARHRDGSWRVFEAIGRNLLDDPAVRGIIVNSRDVTGRRRAEEENLRLAAFARENPDPIFECDAEARVLWANAAGERVVRELGVDAPEWLLPDDHARLVREAAATGSGARGQEARVGGRVFAWAYHPQPALGTVHLFGEEVTERKRVEERLMHDALHDALTGLPNRHLFMERLGECLFRCNQGAGPVRGALPGPRPLQGGERLAGPPRGRRAAGGGRAAAAASVRACDTVARFGGDEFAMLLTSWHGAAEAAVRIADARAAGAWPRRSSLSGYEVFTSASIGIALATFGYDRPEHLLRNADMAMYRAKGSAGAAWRGVRPRDARPGAGPPADGDRPAARAASAASSRCEYQPIVVAGHRRACRAWRRCALASTPSAAGSRRPTSSPPPRRPG